MYKNDPPSTFLKLFIICLFHFPFHSVANHPGFNLPEDKASITVPFKLVNNFIVIEFTLNKKQKAHFIVDTGVRTPILLNKKIGEKLGLTPIREVIFSGVGKGKKIRGTAYYGIEMESGELSGQQLPMIVIDTKINAPKLTYQFEADGILGYQLFSRFVVSIDFEQQLLTLTKPGHFKPDSEYESAEIEIRDTKPYLNTFINIDGKNRIPVTLFIDTGANHSLLLESNFERPFLIPENTLATNLGRGLNGNIRGAIATIESLEIESFKIYKVNTSFPFIGEYAEQNNVDGRNGTIGTRLLSNFHITFDYTKGIFYLKSAAGGTGRTSEEQVTHVLP